MSEPLTSEEETALRKALDTPDYAEAHITRLSSPVPQEAE